MASVFGEDVVKLLEAVPTSDDGMFGMRTYSVPLSSVVNGASGINDVIKTVGGVDDKSRRQAFFGALIGTLVKRQTMWGALFNYPRTLLVMPDASFACAPNRNGQMWAKDTTANRRADFYPEDFDQVIWINACFEQQLVGVPGFRSSAPILVEIGIARMHHESRKGARMTPTYSAVRYISEDAFTLNLQKLVPNKTDEAAILFKKLFGDEYEFAPRGTAYADDVVVKNNDPLGYLMYAGATLELLMRERTLAMPEDYIYKGTNTPSHVNPTIIHKAVAASQMPYAAKDIDESTRQPSVMPGHATTDDIIDVLGKVVGFGGGGMETTTQSAIPSSSNPYEAIGAWDDSDSDEDMPRPLSPFTDSEDEFTF